MTSTHYLIHASDVAKVHEALKQAQDLCEKVLMPGTDKYRNVCNALAILDNTQGVGVVAQLHPNQFKPSPEGSEWCREILLYSPNNEGDKLRGVNQRVKLYAIQGDSNEG
jgi:hypothetical protein